MGLRPDIAVDRLLADRSKLLAYIWSIVRDFHATEDVFQEVVVAAMSHAEEIKDTEHLLSWARQAARFRGIDWLRRQKRQPLLLDDDVLDLLEGQWNRFDAVPPHAWTDAVRVLRRQVDRLCPTTDRPPICRRADRPGGRPARGPHPEDRVRGLESNLSATGRLHPGATGRRARR